MLALLVVLLFFLSFRLLFLRVLKLGDGGEQEEGKKRSNIEHLSRAKVAVV